MKKLSITGVITVVNHRADPPYIRIKPIGSKATLKCFISPVNWGNVWVDGVISVTGIPEMTRPLTRLGQRFKAKLKAIYVNSVESWPGSPNNGSH